MRDFAARDRTIAAAILLAARTVYAYNWYDIGAVPTPVEQHFGIGTVPFGIVLASFLVGAAIFQIPAGFVALRWGNRATSIAAIAIMGSFCVASGFSPSWQVLALLRFGAGVGAAFFFAPALGLITGYYAEGARGPVIGLYNGGFSLGSAIGLIGGAVLAEQFGWGATLAVGGVLLLAVLPLAVLGLPTPSAARRPASWREVVRAARPVVTSPALWALTIGGAGLWAGYYVAAQYFVEFASTVHPLWSLTLAAALPTAMILTEIVSGPFGGWSAERTRDMRRIFVGWGLVSAGLIAAVPFLSLTALWPAFLALGFAAGINWAVLYLVPSYLPGLQGEGFSLAISLLNSVQIFVGSALALAFALLAAGYGFTAAWVFVGIVSAGFLVTFRWVPAVGQRSRAGPAPTSSAGARAPDRAA